MGEQVQTVCDKTTRQQMSLVVSGACTSGSVVAHNKRHLVDTDIVSCEIDRQTEENYAVSFWHQWTPLHIACSFDGQGTPLRRHGRKKQKVIKLLDWHIQKQIQSVLTVIDSCEFYTLEDICVYVGLPDGLWPFGPIQGRWLIMWTLWLKGGEISIPWAVVCQSNNEWKAVEDTKDLHQELCCVQCSSQHTQELLLFSNVIVTYGFKSTLHYFWVNLNCVWDMLVLRLDSKQRVPYCCKKHQVRNFASDICYCGSKLIYQTTIARHSAKPNI